MHPDRFHAMRARAYIPGDQISSRNRGAPGRSDPGGGAPQGRWRPSVLPPPSRAQPPGLVTGATQVQACADFSAMAKRKKQMNEVRALKQGQSRRREDPIRSFNAGITCLYAFLVLKLVCVLGFGLCTCSEKIDSSAEKSQNFRARRRARGNRKETLVGALRGCNLGHTSYGT